MAIAIPHGQHGAYAEQVAVPVQSAVRVPAGASDAEAETLPMNGLTARLALLNLRPGQTVAVTGAAGAVGGYAVQLAKAGGLRISADASPATGGSSAPWALTSSSPAARAWQARSAPRFPPGRLAGQDRPPTGSPGGLDIL
jgi:hypothetical protein